MVARSRRNGCKDGAPVPPARTRIDFEGLPIAGKASLTILRLGPEDGALLEKDLPALTTTTVVDVVDGKMSTVLDRVAENEVYAITVSA